MSEVIEREVLYAAEKLSDAERRLNQEYLLRVATGITSFQAQKMAEVAFLADVREAQAKYEIALNRMRKS